MTQEELVHGLIERVTFHNPQNGFCVLRVKTQDSPDLITVVGYAGHLAVGEHIECNGRWHQDATYGKQFKADHLQCIPPSSLDGIEKYLSSGLIKGVGPATAKILIEKFGEEVFKVLENEPERLMAVSGITKKRKKQIIDSFAAQKSVKDIMVFLQSHGVSTTRAVKIYKYYGDAAISKVTENPYRLAKDIQSIGFKTADDLAVRLGCDLNSIERARAGVHHVLNMHCEHGHVAAAYQHLIDESAALLEIDSSIIQSAIDEEIKSGTLILEQLENQSCIFTVLLHQAERESTAHLLRILNGNLPWGEIDFPRAIAWVEEKTGLQLANSQKKAIEIVLQHKLAIITGGPGVGKTTVVNSVLKMMQAKRLSVSLCAPTGRAAKRMTETTNVTAKTIHRLLGFNPETRSFSHHEGNPLPIDVLIVDEASMIDIVLFHHLLKAIPDHAAVFFVGDVDQLPSVGPGAVLMDMINSTIIPTVRLTEIFRQASNSKIIVNAHRINQGEIPLPNEIHDSDFYTIYLNNTDEIQSQLIELVSKRLPDYTHCNPLSDIQVLTPMNRGGLGTIALNTLLQKSLNGEAEPKVIRYGFTFSPGDKVIQTVNNYDKDIFNGDIGYVTQVNLDKQMIKVLFDQHLVEYDFSDLDELSLAYAVSIHKSQGSEFPIVIVLLATQHYLLLAKNLLYTAVTRGKRLVVLVGEKKAINIAIKNNQDKNRLTTLSTRLRQC